MAPERGGAHDVAVVRYNENRLELLRSGKPVDAKHSAQTLSAGARKAILAFLEAKRGEVGRLHFRNYLSWLPVAAVRLKDSFLTPKADIQARFNEAFPPKTDAPHGYSFFSRQTAGSVLMSFWRHRLKLEGKPYPDHLRLKFGKWKSPYNGSDMLSRDDVASMADEARNFRDKAWIWTLFNSGCRPGEIFQLRVGDVVVHDEGFIELRVVREKDSAPEPAPVYEDAVPALLSWLNAHPTRADPAAPLWVDLGGNRTGKAASYRAMYKALESAAKRAKITKPVTAYALRRSRLTMLAKDPAISTSILEKVAGWVPGSKVARHYVHISGKDVIGALNARYGVKMPDPRDQPAPPRAPARCGRCKTVNPAGAVYCMTCGGPLSLPAVKQIEEARSAEARLAELLRKPEAVEFLAKLLAEGEKGKNRGGRQSDVGDDDSSSEEPHSSIRSDGPAPGPRPPAQKVVPLSDAEGLILSGYEFVAALGADRAVLRAPPAS